MTKDFPERFNDRAASAIMCSWNNVHCVGGYILYVEWIVKTDKKTCKCHYVTAFMKYYKRCMRERNRIRSIEISLKYFDPVTYRNCFYNGDCTRYFQNFYARGVNNVKM